MSAATPDLSLPATAPSMARYHDEPMSLHPAALYTLVDLSDAELSDLERECEGACLEMGNEPGASVRLSPQPRFAGQSLRSVFDYHLEHIGHRPEEPETQEQKFDRWYFIVAVEKEWRDRGVILVALDDDDLECKVDWFRIKAFDVGLIVGSLQIGNSSWEEEKESYEFHPPGNGDGDEDGDDDDDNDEGPPAPTKNVPLGYYIPIYIHSSLSEDKVVTDLEPFYKMKKPEDYACRVQAKLTPVPSTSTSTSGTTSFSPTQTQDLIQQAATLHPSRCAKNKYLHKTHILIIDTADPVENGMLMLELPPWDAGSKTDVPQIGKDLAATLATSPPYKDKHIRIPYDCYSGLQTRFLILANNDATWPSPTTRTQPVYLVFQYDTGTDGHSHKELGFGWGTMDPGASRRKPGEERLIYVPDLVEQWKRIGWSYDEAVGRFPWECRERRFVEGLDTRFFVCVDGDEVIENTGTGTGTGVLLVRRDWDGEVWGGRTREELLGLPVEGVKSVRVPIKEAIATLDKGRKGETDGMSESLRDFFS